MPQGGTAAASGGGCGAGGPGGVARIEEGWGGGAERGGGGGVRLCGGLRWERERAEKAARRKAVEVAAEPKRPFSSNHYIYIYIYIGYI